MFCPNCGKQIPNDSKFCTECGGSINDSVPVQTNNNSQGLVCPRCHSNNMDVQLVAVNQQRGCLSIFLYIFLGITIIGIPLLIVLLVAKGQKSNMTKHCVCKNCGYSYSLGGSNFNITPVIALIVSIVLLGVMFGVVNNAKKTEDNTNKEYKVLDLKTMHTDYDKNEIAAKDKYVDKYYSYTGKIEDIVEYYGSHYLAFCSNVNSRKICLYTYFNNTDELKTLKKGDSTTVYCKNNGLKKEDYSITYYSMNGCTLKSPQTTTTSKSK